MLGTSLVGGMVLGGPAHKPEPKFTKLRSFSNLVLCLNTLSLKISLGAVDAAYFELTLKLQFATLLQSDKHPLAIPFGDLYFQGHILFLLATSMSTRGSKTLHAVAGHVGERVHEARDSSLSEMAGSEIILNAGR